MFANLMRGGTYRWGRTMNKRETKILQNQNFHTSPLTMHRLRRDICREDTDSFYGLWGHSSCSASSSLFAFGLNLFKRRFSIVSPFQDRFIFSPFRQPSMLQKLPYLG